MLSHAFGASLDRRLAAGCPPENAVLLAARAQDIVSLPARQAMAANWDHLLRVAHRQHRQHRQHGQQGSRSPLVPLRRRAIVAAEPAIRELIQALTNPLPVRAQGVAMATILLTDATGPVYNPHSPVTLAAALDAAIAQLDPALPLMRAA